INATGNVRLWEWRSLGRRRRRTLEPWRQRRAGGSRREAPDRGAIPIFCYPWLRLSTYDRSHPQGTEMRAIDITLSLSVRDGDKNEINFYEVSQALIGFEQSLALTTHLIVNGEIITQAPALKGAAIVAFPPADGSWKLSAAILVTAATGL